RSRSRSRIQHHPDRAVIHLNAEVTVDHGAPAQLAATVNQRGPDRLSTSNPRLVQCSHTPRSRPAPFPNDARLPIALRRAAPRHAGAHWPDAQRDSTGHPRQAQTAHTQHRHKPNRRPQPQATTTTTATALLPPNTDGRQRHPYSLLLVINFGHTSATAFALPR